MHETPDSVVLSGRTRDSLDHSFPFPPPFSRTQLVEKQPLPAPVHKEDVSNDGNMDEEDTEADSDQKVAEADGHADWDGAYQGSRSSSENKEGIIPDQPVKKPRITLGRGGACVICR